VATLGWKERRKIDPMVCDAIKELCLDHPHFTDVALERDSTKELQHFEVEWERSKFQTISQISFIKL